MNNLGAEDMIDEAPLFLAEETVTRPGHSVKKSAWKVLVIDDDRSVHEITSMVLRRFSFEDRGLELVSGYSGKDAQLLMREHPDTAVILLDVVMESEQAGLDVVRYVRDALKNQKVRIILRTGQPGYAPELEVITGYDINDYREKTELTQDKLITAIITALRSFRDLVSIDNNKVGLENVVEATGVLFGPRSEKKLALDVLGRLDGILGLDAGDSVIPSSGFAARQEGGKWSIYAGMGEFESGVGQDIFGTVSPNVSAMVNSVLQSGRYACEANRYVATFKDHNQRANILFFQGQEELTDMDCRLLELFMANVALAFRNIGLNREIFETQHDIAFTLGEIIEARSHECGSHVKRVADCAQLMGELAGYPEHEVELLRQAAALHDLGKAVISDQLLQKSAPLEPDELAQIRGHATVGFHILKKSRHKAMQLGATVAHQHHERWDGKGYPQGLRGEEIHVFARIVALMDVFDAITHHRVYRNAWPRDEALSYIKKSRKTLFDPALVDLFFAHLEKFLAIQDKTPDRKE
ncbi:MAG: response regulator receiver modulated metal dependent phosphohydrolase [Magnetococcales bacterium]|nr:response regulator receiver modulated metal dependent phosphohydrolase [Magnetococcales bacterium]HIJ85269.1 DUF3369 domain-containing protein [Magnetococcales bacterium]